MDSLKRNSPNSKANLKCSEIAETDENEFPVLHNGTRKEIKNVFYSSTSASFKKILSERKETPSPVSSLSPHLNIATQSELVTPSDANGTSYINSPTFLHSYDPIINYTSPRPKFLLYNPHKHRELLRRIEGEKMRDEEIWSVSSPNDSNERGDDSDYGGKEETEKNALYPWVGLLLIFGVLFFNSFCMSVGSYFEGHERSADNNQKIQKCTPPRLVRKSYFPENILGGLMSLSQMCPMIKESTCYPVDYDLALMNISVMGEGIKREVPVDVFQDSIVKNRGLLYDHSMVKEKVERDEQDKGDSASGKEDNAQYFINNIDTVKQRRNARDSFGSLLGPVVQDGFTCSSTNINDTAYIESPVPSMTSLTSPPEEDQSFPRDDEELENFELPLNSGLELESVYSFNVLSEGALLLFSILLVSLIIVIGLSSSPQKYFHRPHLNSLLLSPSPSSSEFCLKPEKRENSVTVISVMEENVDKALDISVKSTSSRLNVVPSLLDHSNFGLTKGNGIRPPRAELLGEFSLTGTVVCNDGLGSKLKEIDYPDSQSPHYKKRRTTKMFSPSNMLDSSPLESTSSSLSSKVIAYKGEASSDFSSTPLRRSRRLQKC